MRGLGKNPGENSRLLSESEVTIVVKVFGWLIPLSEPHVTVIVVLTFPEVVLVLGKQVVVVELLKNFI